MRWEALGEISLRYRYSANPHGKGVGVVIDGFPAGFACDMEYIERELARRAPGQGRLTTGRREEDKPILLSGMLENVTTGAPVCILIQNNDTHSKDYEDLRTTPRPSHSDYTGGLRYRGSNDIRGGGHFSGRLTAPDRFCRRALQGFFENKKHGVVIGSHIYSVGEITDKPFDLVSTDRELLARLQRETLPLIDHEVEEKIQAAVEKARMGQDSVGGVVECAVAGAAAGIGSPMFQNVESRIASILYSVPAVKGVEFGMGFAISGKRGSEVNDCYIKDGGVITTKTKQQRGDFRRDHDGNADHHKGRVQTKPVHRQGAGHPESGDGKRGAAADPRQARPVHCHARPGGR